MGGNVFSKPGSKSAATSATAVRCGVAVVAVFLLARIRARVLRAGGSGLTVAGLRALLARGLAVVNANPFLQALAWSSGTATLLYLGRLVWNELYERLVRLFYCSVTLSSKDENFRAVVDYVSKLQAGQNTLLVAETKKKKFNRKSWMDEWKGIGSRQPPEMDFRPSKSGAMSSFSFQDNRIMMWRRQGQTITTGYDRQPLELETITLATWSGRVQVLKDLIRDALVDQFEVESDETKIFVLSDSWMGGWESALTKKPRPKGSIVLDGSQGEDLIADAKMFLESSQWYAERGIPYRRGYLLHGPPGCGKTSFCQVLAGELKLDVCMLSLSNDKLNDAKLAQNFREAPESSIILLEDVDAVFVDRDVKKKRSGGGTGVSFSGLLNAIDGVASQEGRLFFMTTNFPEKLDAALVRPGRCDVKVELKRASRNQMKRLFLRFFEGKEALAVEFAKRLPEYELSMAQLQGHLLEHRASASSAVSEVPSLLRASKPQPVKKMSVWSHLRRIGLERLCPLFEMHGYRLQSDLHGLSVDTVKQWDVELRYDTVQSERLSRLLKEEEKLMQEDYPLASIATIRDAFFAAYPIDSMRLLMEAKKDSKAAGKRDDVDNTEAYDAKLLAPPKLLRQTSYEKRASSIGIFDAPPGVPPVGPSPSQPSAATFSGVAGSDTPCTLQHQPVTRASIEARLEELSKQLADRLSLDGRGDVSLWQLRWLLDQNEDPEAAVRNAAMLTRGRTDANRAPHHMSVFQFLVRAGHAKWWHKFEDAGYKRANELSDKLKSESDLKAIGLPGSVARVLAVLIANEAKHRNITCGLLHPDRARVRRLFRLAYPDCTDTEMSAFADAITTKAGKGLCSVMQLESFLYKEEVLKEGESLQTMGKRSRQKRGGRREPQHATPMAAIAACHDALVNVVKCPRPPKQQMPRPSQWIHKALKHHDRCLTSYGSKFVDAGLSTRAEVLAEPPLEESELEALGVRKLGHRRKILRLMKRLAAGEDDGVLKVGDSVTSDFGPGKVEAHREEDDVYAIKLGWGATLFSFEECTGIERVVEDSPTRQKGDHDEGKRESDLITVGVIEGKGDEQQQQQQEQPQRVKSKHTQKLAAGTGSAAAMTLAAPSSS